LDGISRVIPFEIINESEALIVKESMVQVCTPSHVPCIVLHDEPSEIV